MTRTLALITAAAAVVALGGTWYATQIASGDGQDRYAECRAGRIAGGAGAIGGPFELLNAKGETVTDADVITGPSLIYFGYTFCPDVCPLDNSRNVEAIDILEDRGQMVTPIFISIDPDRDTPEVVGDFAANLHERMIGLTGSPEQVKEASRAYKTYYKAQPKDDDYYLVDHSTFSYLVTPQDGFVEFFRRDVTPNEMADQIGCFMDKM